MCIEKSEFIEGNWPYLTNLEVTSCHQHKVHTHTLGRILKLVWPYFLFVVSRIWPGNIESLNYRNFSPNQILASPTPILWQNLLPTYKQWYNYVTYYVLTLSGKKFAFVLIVGCFDNFNKNHSYEPCLWPCWYEAIVILFTPEYYIEFSFKTWIPPNIIIEN